METKTMVKVRLVVDRNPHKDSIYGTGVEWRGMGDVQSVPEDAWLKMKRHADVYAEALEEAPLPPSAPVDISSQLVGADLNSMTDDEVVALGKSKGLHHRTKPENMRLALAKLQAVAPNEQDPVAQEPAGA